MDAQPFEAQGWFLVDPSETNEDRRNVAVFLNSADACLFFVWKYASWPRPYELHFLSNRGDWNLTANVDRSLVQRWSTIDGLIQRAHEVSKLVDASFRELCKANGINLHELVEEVQP